MADQTRRLRDAGFYIPEFLRRRAGQGIAVVTAHALMLSVTAQTPASAPAPEEDIRPARPVVEIPVEEGFPWMALWVPLAVTVLIAVVVWLLRRRGKTPGVTALHRALRDLEAVDRDRTRLEPGPLADRAAGVVREFIAGRFGIAAPARTTEEFLRTLAAGAPPPLAAHGASLGRFLQACDMAKFAGAEFDNAERLELLSAAIGFVRAAGDGREAA